MTATNGRFPDLVTPLYDAAQKRIRSYPCHSNRASGLGGDCERQLVYQRTNGEDAKPIDVNLKLIFEEGDVHETDVKRKLAEAGIEFREQQREIDWKAYQITGHIDGTVIHDGIAVPVDIKSSSDHIWRSIAYRGRGIYAWQEVERAFQSKPWLRKYLAQITLYMLGKNTDRGILFFKNKTTGAVAQVNVDLDYGYAESLLQRAERINAHVAAGTLPDRIPYGEDTCGECPFAHLCLPDLVPGRAAISYVPDEEAAKRFDERGEAEEASKAFKDAHEWVVDWCWTKYPDKDRLAVGGWLIEKHKTQGNRRMTNITRLPQEA